jgi:hypothetical protein
MLSSFGYRHLLGTKEKYSQIELNIQCLLYLSCSHYIVNKVISLSENPAPGLAYCGCIQFGNNNPTEIYKCLK